MTVWVDGQLGVLHGLRENWIEGRINGTRVDSITWKKERRTAWMDVQWEREVGEWLVEEVCGSRGRRRDRKDG
jgi:hypothetical protein